MNNDDDLTLKKIKNIFDNLLLGEYPESIEIMRTDSPEVQELCVSANNFISKFNEATAFINALADGNLEVEPPAKNLYISQYKMLHSNLKHLTWQTQQVAKGDLNQQVHFLGDFSAAFNEMIEALKEKRRLEEELRTSEQKLRESNATKDKFFSIIAHDLKGPMGAMNSLVEILASDFDSFSEDEKKEFIGLVYDSSSSTLSLLNSLLDWSRQQMGKIPFSPDVVFLDSVIQSNLNLLKLNADKKKIRLFAEYPKEITAYGDANMITTVLRNLTSNAIKFTPENGYVKISASVTDNFVLINVSDNGLGIKPDDIDKLFRIDVHHTTKGTNDEGGTGLGLIMCKDFVEKNGGKIWVESTVGKGSDFKFTVPLA